MPSTQAALLDEIQTIRLIDTHEHLFEESDRLKHDLDFGVLLMMYAWDDLAVAGLSRENAEFLVKQGEDPAEKWRRIAPLWPFVRHTGFIRAWRYSMEAAFGIGDLDADAAVELSNRIRNANKPGVNRRMIREVAGIDRCLVNALDQVYRQETDREIFIQDIGMGKLYDLGGFPFDRIQEESGMDLDTFDDLLRIVDWYLETFGAESSGVKNQCAYARPLDFGDPTMVEAARSFDRFLKNPKSVTIEEVLPFQDRLMRHIARRAGELGLPVKLHTGYLGGWNGMRMEQIQVAPLLKLIRDYPRTRFVLFHIAYPYQNEALAIAKHYQNVWLDMCWTWIIDPPATRGFLRQALETVPLNKLFGFGGDYLYAEQVAGHARMAREGAVRVLAEMVEDGTWSREEAGFAARRLLRENALEFFDLPDQASADSMPGAGGA